MNFRVLLLCAALGLSACGKHQKAAEPPPTPATKPVLIPTPTPPPAPAAPVAPAASAPAAAPAPASPAIKSASQAIVLCYHRFEEKPKPDGLGIKPSEFEGQMQKLKDQGITVITMADFLAWRRGEKDIPAKSAVITLDDGWLSGYVIAWPILKKFGYPFTMYIYTDYVKGGPKSGGQSMTWEQLAEMRDAGVNIDSHTVSHSNLRSKAGKTDDQYHQWLETELGQSKQILEQQLGIHIHTLAYPYGNYNDQVEKVALENGYEAAFTVYGQHLHQTGDPTTIGRYAVTSTNPKIFETAINFAGSAATGAEVSLPPAAGVLTEPMQGETTSNPKPEIKINLASFGAVDPKTVEMRVSGFGLVSSAYDASSQTLSYTLHQRLREHDVTVIVSARAGGKKAAASWTFYYDPTAKSAAAPTPVTPPAAPMTPSTPPPAPNAASSSTAIPKMVPAQ